MAKEFDLSEITFSQENVQMGRSSVHLTEDETGRLNAILEQVKKQKAKFVKIPRASVFSAERVQDLSAGVKYPAGRFYNAIAKHFENSGIEVKSSGQRNSGAFLYFNLA